jgi:hypothetical protein
MTSKASNPDGVTKIEIIEIVPHSLSLIAEDAFSLFMCPVCHDLFTSPLVANCGHSFCSKCISNIQRCPLDEQAISSSSAPQNSVLISLMQRITTPCRFKCGVQIALTKMHDHNCLRKTASSLNMKTPTTLTKSSQTVPGLY